MQLSTTRETAKCGATRQFPCMVSNPIVRYRNFNSFLLVSIMRQNQPVDTIESYRKEYLETFWGIKGGRRLGLTT